METVCNRGKTGHKSEGPKGKDTTTTYKDHHDESGREVAGGGGPTTHEMVVCSGHDVPGGDGTISEMESNSVRMAGSIGHMQGGVVVVVGGERCTNFKHWKSK